MHTAGELDFFGQAEELRDQVKFRQLLRLLYKKEWVVYAKQPFGGPEQVVSYLGCYTHRIENIEDGKVTFSYKDYRKEGQKKSMTLDAVEFIRRFLQHCLPHGFQKIRYYGILATRNRKTKLANLQKCLGYQPPAPAIHVLIEPNKDNLTCPACGKETIQSLVLPALRMKFELHPASGCHFLKIGLVPRQRAPPDQGNDFFKLG